MSEYIISEKDLQYMRNQCYEAGKLGKEAFTVRGHSGHEIIRCKDCRHCNDEGVLSSQFFCVSAHWNNPGYGVKTRPDGYCFWAEKRES